MARQSTGNVRGSVNEVDAHREALDATLVRHEIELQRLADRFRLEVLVPVCRRYKLTFISGNGSFYFRKQRTRKDGSDYYEPTYGVREDLEDTPPQGYCGLSERAKQALGPILDILNQELSKDYHFGYLIADVS